MKAVTKESNIEASKEAFEFLAMT